MIPIRQNLQYLSLENQRNTPVKMGQIFVRVNFQFLNFGESRIPPKKFYITNLPTLVKAGKMSLESNKTILKTLNDPNF